MSNFVNGYYHLVSCLPAVTTIYFYILLFHLSGKATCQTVDPTGMSATQQRILPLQEARAVVPLGWFPSHIEVVRRFTGLK